MQAIQGIWLIMCALVQWPIHTRNWTSHIDRPQAQYELELRVHGRWAFWGWLVLTITGILLPWGWPSVFIFNVVCLAVVVIAQRGRQT